MDNNVMISKDIYWVGKIDGREVPFHRLTLSKGTTYNSYLIKSHKPTIIDTVDISFGAEYVKNLSNIIELEKIQYIVINHTEPDHSGALAGLASKAKNATIVCTEIAVPELKEMYRLHNRNFLVVRDGDTLDIGEKTLRFREVPYLHTAETMITYLEEDKILFPCDIFSTHVANYEYFNDAAKEDITEDFIGYYKAIMHPHRRYVRNLMEVLRDMEVNMIAPSHGYIIRENVEKFINIYDTMSTPSTTSKKVSIVFTTLKGSTRKIANLFKENFEQNNIKVKLLDANKVNKEEILSEIESSDGILFGTSTKYGDMIGKIEEILKELKSINLEGKLGGAFGSYGWSGESIEIIQDYLNETNLNVLSTSSIIKSTGMTHVKFPIRVRFSPSEESIKAIEDGAIFISDLLLNETH